MNFEDIAKSIWAQFVMAWNAPAPFLAAVLAVWFLMRSYYKSSYETRLSNAESTENLLERQLQDYKDKTGSDTADAVKARIDALEARLGEMVPRLAAIGPRKIDVEQRQVMVPLLDPFRGRTVEISSDAASADAAQMSKGLVSAFHSAGWIAQTSIVVGLGNPPPSGVGLRVPDPSNLTAAQSAIAHAFRTAGLSFDFQARPLRQAPAGAHHRPQAEAEIILTTRLED